MGKPLLVLVLLVSLTLALCGCETTTAGGVADATSPDVAPEVRARALYERTCSRCHALFMPSSFLPEEWPGYVRRYGAKARLNEEQRNLVLWYLQTESSKALEAG